MTKNVAPKPTQKRRHPFLSDSAEHSHLAAQWHPTKNKNNTPENTSIMSHAPIWWICDMNHDWEARMFSRAQGRGCPVCAGAVTLPGFNDLATRMPALAADWHASANGNLTPDTVTTQSNRSVRWQCRRGHEWSARIAHRSNGSGCPTCAGQQVLPGFNDLATTHPDIAATWNTEANSVPITTVTAGSTKRAHWRCAQGHDWETRISNRTRGTGCPTCAGRRVLPGFNDLATTHPALAAQWVSPTEPNKHATPHDVSAGSGMRVIWQCANEHTWSATVQRRSKGSGCPECARIR